MFIELADHLRCPSEHDEQFLVLLPDRTEDRWVRAGHLGCPVCGRAFTLEDGALNTGDAPAGPCRPTTLTGGAVAALSGLGGPGGYLVLIGGVGSVWDSLRDAVPAVGLVAVNPAPAVRDGPGVSVLRSGRIPLRSSSMRAVVLGPGYAGDAAWVGEAMRVTLPGLRIVGESDPPALADLEILATADGCWVGTKLRNRREPRPAANTIAPPP